MSVKAEVEALKIYCEGHGANIGCGAVRIGSSVGVDMTPNKAVDIVVTGQALPFDSNSLDYIVSCAALEHIDAGPITILREWTRCVRVGGTVAVVVPDADYGMWAMTGDTGIPGQLIKPRREMEHLHAFTLSSLRLLFEFAGLDIVEARHLDREPIRRETTLVCAGMKSLKYKEST